VFQNKNTVILIPELEIWDLHPHTLRISKVQSVKMRLSCFKILPLISVLISTYVFIAIILINVGGVNKSSSSGLGIYTSQNRAFNLIKVRPLTSPPKAKYHTYKNPVEIPCQSSRTHKPSFRNNKLVRDRHLPQQTLYLIRPHHLRLSLQLPTHSMSQ
jgi:hypothetical protein